MSAERCAQAEGRHSNTRFQQSASLSLKRLDIDISGGQAVALAKRFAVATTGATDDSCTLSIARACRRAGPRPALNLTPRALGWDRIHFAVRHLAAGAVWTGLSRDEERCLVLLRGEFEVELGRRVAPGRPARRRVQRLSARRLSAGADAASGSSPGQPCEIADCRAVVVGRRCEPRVIRPEDCGYEIRGGGNATRQIVDIMPPAFPADRLLICEVFTPGGNWSSYPPHKHDTDDPPREVDLDEIYYFRYPRSERIRLPARLYQAARRHAARHARRRRRGARRLSPVCYSAWLRCVLPERARGRAPVDGGQRRSALRAASAASGRRPIRGCRWCRRP